MLRLLRKYWPFVFMGLLLGVGGMVLSWLGNPPNTGICASCFLENIAGAIGLHDNPRMQYLRPEIIGFILGSFFFSLARSEFLSRGGSSPLLRFGIGIFLVIGCAVFIGCPVKLILRLAAGDLTVLPGLAGLVAGIYVGLEFVENGFSLGEPQPTSRASGLVLPGMMLLLLVFLFLRPRFIGFSATGAGALYAPPLLSLGVGLVIGGAAQYTQFCITGGIARIFLWGPREVLNCPRSTGLLLSIGSFFLFALATAVATGQFHPGVEGQPSSTTAYGWTFLGMALVGFASVLIRGCPLRQMIAAGEGDNDAAAAVLGMLLGAALVQNWELGSTPGGTPPAGRIAVLAGLFFLVAVGLANRRRGYGIAPEYQAGLD